MTTATLPNRDPALFLQLAAQGAAISTHAELWRWLQGDVQQWLPHDALLVGWGDFASNALEYDIISSVPGLRSHDFTAARISPLLRYLHVCWSAAQESACEVNLTGSERLLRGCSDGPLQAIASMRTAVVHGIAAGPSERGRIFAALSTQPSMSVGSASALKLLVSFIDTALRRIPPRVTKAAARRDHENLPSSPLKGVELSEREREIMQWVALGKTNPEIGCILSISEFTVKNHLKSVFAKLDVSNRAQAVARLTQDSAYA